MEGNLTCLSGQHVARRFDTSAQPGTFSVWESRGPSIYSSSPSFSHTVCSLWVRRPVVRISLRSGSLHPSSMCPGKPRRTDGGSWSMRQETAVAALFSAFTARSVPLPLSYNWKFDEFLFPPLKKKEKDLKCCWIYEGREYEKYLQNSIEFVSGWVMCVRHRGENSDAVCLGPRKDSSLLCLVPTPVGLKKREKETNKQMWCVHLCACFVCPLEKEKKKLTFFGLSDAVICLATLPSNGRPVIRPSLQHTVAAHVGDTQTTMAANQQPVSYTCCTPLKVFYL